MEKKKLRWLITHSELFFNMYFIIFLLFLHKPLLYASQYTPNTALYANLLGATFILVIVLDFIGTIIKIPHIYSRANYKEGEASTMAVFPLWLFRIAVTMSLVVMAFKTFGWELDGGSPLVIAILIGILIKEFFVLAYIFMKSEKTDEFTDDKLKEYSFKEFLADSFIWLYISVAYTALWETIGLQNALREYSGGEFWTQVLAATILFFLIVIPMRMVYFIEEVILVNTAKERLIYLTGFALMLFTALWKIY